MKIRISLIVLAFCSLFSMKSQATAKIGKNFDKAIFVIFENTNYALAMKQPFFKKLADQGAQFSNFTALIHPSQGNYIALTSGDLNGVRDDRISDVNAENIVDLLESKGLTWKIYAEDYPGNCFTGGTSGNYARKHNPFISYLNIQRNSARCANIVSASQFAMDVNSDHLPNYSFYIPNVKNDGHDTGVAYADQWYQKAFSPYLNSPNFLNDTILISTFDESGGSDSKNQIYLSIVGSAVKPSVVSQSLNIYSLLKMIEDNWSLGDLGKGDKTATEIPNIWK